MQFAIPLFQNHVIVRTPPGASFTGGIHARLNFRRCHSQIASFRFYLCDNRAAYPLNCLNESKRRYERVSIGRAEELYTDDGFNIQRYADSLCACFHSSLISLAR
jgi:hypothetical protein